jgi:hypothetical protein
LCRWRRRCVCWRFSCHLCRGGAPTVQWSWQWRYMQRM